MDAFELMTHRGPAAVLVFALLALATAVATAEPACAAIQPPSGAFAAVIQCRALCALVPTHEGHFLLASALLHSLVAHLHDPGALSVRLVTGDAVETRKLHGLLEHASVGWRRGCALGDALDVAMLDADRASAAFNVSIDRYASPRRKFDGNGMGGAAPGRNKYLWQFAKKMYAARALDYEHVVVLDSESFAVRPFAVRALFAGHLASPRVWLARDYGNVLFSCAQMLDLTPRSLPKPNRVDRMPWSYTWIWRKRTIERLFARVESRGQSLYAVATRVFATGRCFEDTLHGLFVLTEPDAAFPYAVATSTQFTRGSPDAGALQTAERTPSRLAFDFWNPMIPLYSMPANASWSARLAPLASAFDAFGLAIVRNVDVGAVAAAFLPRAAAAEPFEQSGGSLLHPHLEVLRRLACFVLACPTLRILACSDMHARWPHVLSIVVAAAAYSDRDVCAERVTPRVAALLSASSASSTTCV